MKLEFVLVQRKTSFNLHLTELDPEIRPASPVNQNAEVPWVPCLVIFMELQSSKSASLDHKSWK